jgi:hypothetical protein
VSPVRVCLAGLPGAGKSSYIVALWAYLGAGPSGDSYRITGYPEQIAYLKELADRWFNGQKLDRNTPGTIRDVEFRLAAPGRQDIDVAAPDLPGEAFKQAVTARRIDREIADLVVGSDLLVFFVNAKHAQAFHPLAEIPPGEDSDPEKTIPFDPSELDTDILQSDLIQQIRYLIRDRDHAPIVAVIISAWDLCVQSGMSPEEWLADSQPMFAQVLRELARTTSTAIFGVSAQGDDYEANPEIIQTPPLERVFLVDSAGVRSNDITRPFQWYTDLVGQI